MNCCFVFEALSQNLDIVATNISGMSSIISEEIGTLFSLTETLKPEIVSNIIVRLSAKNLNNNSKKVLIDMLKTEEKIVSDLFEK